MTINPDPKPGRWILPLVILGMIAFTFFFIRELPAASTDTTLAAEPATTTTTTLDDPSQTAEPGPENGEEADLDAPGYLSEVDQINSELQILMTEMVAVNEGFDADPREIEFSDAGSRLEDLIDDTQALADQFDGLLPPGELQAHHDALKTIIDFAALTAEDALEGLRSADTGEMRTAALQSFRRHAEDFDTELTNAYNTAGLTR